VPPLTIDRSRFGRVEIDPETVIEFPEGLIGLGGSRYALLSRDHESAFAWLQSLDDPGVALPLTNPHRFFAGYEVALTEVLPSDLGPKPCVETASSKLPASHPSRAPSQIQGCSSVAVMTGPESVRCCWI